MSPFECVYGLTPFLLTLPRFTPPCRISWHKACVSLKRAVHNQQKHVAGAISPGGDYWSVAPVGAAEKAAGKSKCLLSHMQRHVWVSLQSVPESFHFMIDSSLYRPPHTKNWSEISMKTDVSVETLRRALTQLQETLDDKLTQTVLRKMQPYAVDVTLDPDTAHPKLILSEDRKQVKHGDIRQKLPDNPERFDYCIDVLGKEGFCSGRFYFEVQVKGKTDWNLGVVRESINRKGQITASPQDGFWIVALREGNIYRAYAESSVPLSLKVSPQKLGVFVDYEEGLVCFYDVENRSHIYSFTGQTFSEKLIPYLSPCPNDEGENSAPLIISNVI